MRASHTDNRGHSTSPPHHCCVTASPPAAPVSSQGDLGTSDLVIKLVRHGESMANCGEVSLKNMGDYNIPLSDL